MLRKSNEIKWTTEAKKSFNEVNSTLTHAPILASPNYMKYFIILSFSSEHIIATILM